MNTRVIHGIAFERAHRHSGYRLHNDALGITVIQHWGIPPRVGESGSETFSATVKDQEHKTGFRTVDGAVKWALGIAQPRPKRKRIERHPIFISHMGGVWSITYSAARKLLAAIRRGDGFDLNDYGTMLPNRIVERIEQDEGHNLAEALKES